MSIFRLLLWFLRDADSHLRTVEEVARLMDNQPSLLERLEALETAVPSRTGAEE